MELQLKCNACSLLQLTYRNMLQAVCVCQTQKVWPLRTPSICCEFVRQLATCRHLKYLLTTLRDFMLDTQNAAASKRREWRQQLLVRCAELVKRLKRLSVTNCSVYTYTQLCVLLMSSQLSIHGKLLATHRFG